ncbi:nuclear transport factor 2 family protein [Rhizobium leguminosarum]
MHLESERDAATEMAIVIALLNKFGLAMDTHRFELMDEVFVGSDLDCDFAGAKFTDLEVLKAGMLAYHRVFDGTSHSVGNISWRFEGDRAFALSYGIARYLRLGTEGGDQCEIEGWYDDELVKRSEGWRIRSRIARVWRLNGNPAVLATGEGPAFEMHMPQSLINANRSGQLPRILTQS